MKVDMFCTGTFLNKTINEEMSYGQNATVYLTIYILLMVRMKLLTKQNKTKQTHHWQCLIQHFKTWHILNHCNIWDFILNLTSYTRAKEKAFPSQQKTDNTPHSGNICQEAVWLPQNPHSKEYCPSFKLCKAPEMLDHRDDAQCVMWLLVGSGNDMCLENVKLCSTGCHNKARIKMYCVDCNKDNSKNDVQI
jgi:hypothetical protein